MGFQEETLEERVRWADEAQIEDLRWFLEHAVERLGQREAVAHCRIGIRFRPAGYVQLDACLWRDADDSLRIVGTCTDHARHCRTMMLVRCTVIAGKVPDAGNATFEILVIGIGAAVDDGNADTLAAGISMSERQFQRVEAVLQSGVGIIVPG